jgi:hypothetical protein
MQGVLIVRVLRLRQYNYGPITKALPSTVPRVETKGQDVYDCGNQTEQGYPSSVEWNWTTRV